MLVGIQILFSLELGLLVFLFQLRLQAFFETGVSIGSPGFTAIIVILMAGFQNRALLTLSDKKFAFMLDALFPELEESTVLLFKPASSLNKLEELQKRRIAEVLSRLPVIKALLHEIMPRVKSMGIMLLPLILLFSFSGLRYSSLLKSATKLAATSQAPVKAGTVLPATLKSLLLTINPPAYTRRPAFSQHKPEIRAIGNSQASWNFGLTTPGKNLELVFNGHESLSLVPDKAHLHWTGKKIVQHAGFYQLRLDGILSDYYKLELIKDLPPVIRLLSPGQYTLIKTGDKRAIQVRVNLSDDFGVGSAMLMGTLAKGSGEAIKFSQFKLGLNPVFTGSPLHIELGQYLNPQAMNLGPGDELYFYILAADNHGQQSRSDMYYLNMQDTSQVSEVSGLIKGLSPVPEYFRSERQLIMDTEKLLKEKRSLPAGEFRIRSNDLGVDQKLLRQRYSKFLGEESESDPADEPAGKDADSGLPPAGNPSATGSQSAVTSMFTEKPDNADDADIFEPLIKTELKAALDQMWSAERNLRTVKTAEALPFEYRALKLLKLVQQKTRAYVSKTSFKPAARPPFVSRLSGDQSKILQPVFSRTETSGTDRFGLLKLALPVLERLGAGSTLTGADISLLEKTGSVLSAEAMEQPGLYLPATGALHKLLEAVRMHTELRPGGIQAVEKACLKLIPGTVPRPGSLAPASANKSLSGYYFKNLPNGTE